MVLNRTADNPDADLVLSYFNGPAQHSFGLQTSSVGVNVRKALPSLFRDEGQYKALKASFETGTLYRDRKSIDRDGAKSSLEILGQKDRDDYLLFVGNASQNEVVSMSARRSAVHVEAILALSSDGFMDWVVGAPIIRLTGRWMRLLDRPPVPFVTIGDFESLAHPDDRGEIWSAFGALIRGHLTLIEFRPRFIAQDNSYVATKVVATVVGSADGTEPLRIVGSCTEG